MWYSFRISDTFSKEAVIPMPFSRYECAATLGASRPEDAFIELTDISILGVKIVSIAVTIALWILSLTLWRMLPIFLSTHYLKRLSIVFTFTKFSVAAKILPVHLTLISWSTVPSLATTFSCLLPAELSKILSRSKSSNWLKNLLFDCFFCEWKPYLL